MNPMDMLTVIANAAGYIGASLHGCITASSYGVPIVVCNYNRHIKVEGFLELVNVQEAVVYRTKDIYPVFEKKLVVSEEDKKCAITQIESHFQRLADALESKKTTEKFEVALCEYVFSMRNMELNYQQEYRRMQSEKDCEIIERENTWQKKYQEVAEAYQKILDSTVWKMTKPVRVLINKVKRIK